MSSINRRSQLVPLGLCLAFVAVPAIAGCDKTVSKESTTVRKSDGTTSQEDKTVTKSSDGTVKEKTTVKTNNP